MFIRVIREIVPRNRVVLAATSWITVVAWMGLIFYSSSNPAAQDSANTLPILRLFPDWTLQWIYHGAAFAGLSLLTYIALRLSLSWPALAVGIVAFAIAVGYGATDEWHQSFVGGRSADIRDVGRNAIGAFFIVLLAHLTSQMLSKVAKKR